MSGGSITQRSLFVLLGAVILPGLVVIRGQNEAADGSARATAASGAPSASTAAGVSTQPAGPAGGVTINAATGEVIGEAATATSTPVVSRPATNAALTRSNITPIQMQNINRLVIDLNALSSPVRDTSEHERGLAETLRAAPVGATRPSQDSIAKLGANLAAILPSLNLTAPQRRQLAIDLNLALNSGQLGPNEAERVMADARSLLQGSAIKNPTGVEQLLADLSAIVSSTQKAAGLQPTSNNAEGQSAPSQTGQGTERSSAPREEPR
ncbi:MAG: hypothetical protein U1G07_06095 [Verrucomicrobiota bacterium]